MVVVVITVLILVPGQTRLILGAELLVLGVIGLSRTVTALLRTRRAVAGVLPVAMAQAIPMGITMGGLSLLLGRFGGLYWIAGSVTLAVVFAVLASWQLMVAVGEEPDPRPTSARQEP